MNLETSNVNTSHTAASGSAIPARGRLDTDAVIEKRAYRKVFWRIMPFLMLCYVIAYLDRVNVGFAQLQMAAGPAASRKPCSASAPGMFFIGYFLFEVPSNLLMHRVGARIWIARIMITVGPASRRSSCS